MTRPRSMMKSPHCGLIGDLYPCPAECSYQRCAIAEMAAEEEKTRARARPRARRESRA